MIDAVKKLTQLLDPSDKKKYVILFVLMFIGAMFEALGIGLIVPFMGIIVNQDLIYQNDMLRFVYDGLGFTSSGAFLMFCTFVFLGVFIFKNTYLLLFFYLQYRLISNQQIKLAHRLLQGYLTKPYTFHLQRNTAELLRNVNEETRRMFEGLVVPLLLVSAEILVLACITLVLFMVAPYATLVTVIFIGMFILLFHRIFRTKLKVIGQQHQNEMGQMIKWINQGLGASKEVKVRGKESFFVNAFAQHGWVYARAKCFEEVMKQMPRLFIETIVVTAILITIMIVLLQGQDLQALLATLALFAMAAFRLMPSIHRMTASLSLIRYHSSALDVIHNDMVINRIQGSDNEEEEDTTKGKEWYEALSGEKVFKQSIELQNVYYDYPNAQEKALEKISLTIPIGKSVAFVGESGAGKTTLVDVILGLLEPIRGQILVDGKNLHSQLDLWQRKIGYIPQSIYLSDDSVRRNIAFGIEDDQIDDDAVWKALESANLKEFVHKRLDGLNTVIGEHGVRISGGQRQRIGIARALYHNPEVLFLDEATSALDNETEKEIMKAIDGLRGEKTLIIVAHRLTTIQNCNIVYELKEGKIIDVREQSSSQAQ